MNIKQHVKMVTAFLKIICAMKTWIVPTDQMSSIAIDIVSYLNPLVS